MEIKVYCIFDSDYHTDNEKQERYDDARKKNVNLHIWERKEIENYVLNPQVLYRYIEKNRKKGLLNIDIITSKFQSIFEECKEDVHNNYATEIQNRDKSLTFKTASEKAKSIVNSKWNKPEYIVPGKDVIKKLSSWSKHEFGISFNAFQLAKEFRDNEIVPEMNFIIRKIEQCEDFDL